MRDLFREFAIAKRQQESEIERDMSLAWHAANFQRAEKLPPLKTVLRKLFPGRRQSVAEQHAIIHQLAAEMKVSLKRVRFIRKDAA